MAALRAAAEQGDFKFPEFWNFPPFFTLQPVEETRQKQLQLWVKLLLDWAQSTNTWLLAPHTCPLWENTAIGRKLSSEGQRAVLQAMLEAGHAVWEDPVSQSGRLRFMWRKVPEVANDLYTYAAENQMINNVYTLYELHSGEDYAATSFFNMDPWLLREAVLHLQSMGKAALFAGSAADAEGVKFL